jgi:probable H4MPT-linked C1 transfer pathway protein
MKGGIVGLDVGGANLKAADGAGRAVSMPFALWREPPLLPAMLRQVLSHFSTPHILAVTMTGELCDCYAGKREGVLAILDAVEQAAGRAAVRVWRTDGRFADLASARADPLPAAAANWLALAHLAGRYAHQGPALLLDVGSTTSDIVPLLDGRPVPRSRTDPERLRCRELVYTGVRRTPLCALMNGEGAAELFATSLDVCLVLGLLADDSHDFNTADGRPATRAAAHPRLARMLCADLESSSPEEREQLARRCLGRQEQILTAALECVAARLPALPGTVVLGGEGAFLADRVLDRHGSLAGCCRVHLGDVLGAEVSRAACAHAVALLAAEE